MLFWCNLGLMLFVCNLKSSDSELHWPAGSYGIPKPASGCPLSDGFVWREGWRKQDTEDDYSNNAKSLEFHLDGIVDHEIVQRSFCIKTLTTDDSKRPDWPPGKYCIYQKGQCPKDLQSGYVFWDDEDSNNINDKGGTLPDGEYDNDRYKKNTKIYFCCKTDGDKNDPILLPSKSPFYLLAYESAKCQMVKWAVAGLEWIHYNTEYWRNDDAGVGVYPYEAGKKHPTIYYCYYRGCNETLTAVNGSLQSPNYPRKYPDGQYCSWSIMVNTTQQIHLVFTTFSLQNESNTDALYVYDGDDSTKKKLGVYYGGYPPPKEGIYSSSNRMFVIFNSDKTDSYMGFNASYYGVNKSTPSVATTQTPGVMFTSRTSATSHTLEKKTSSRELTSTTDGPSKEGGNRHERKQPQGKDFNVVAVVLPVVVGAFLVAGVIAAFFYCKRKRTEKVAKPNEVIFSARSSDASPISVENPYYGRGLVIANTNEACFSEGNDMYTEIEDTEKTNRKERYMEQQNENPLYEGADTNAVVLNPVYDSTNEPSFSEDEMYTDVKEPEKKNEMPYTEQENENPLYEAADAIYDSST